MLTFPDEYAKGDPYGVNLQSNFQQNRLNYTLKCLKGTTGILLDVGCGMGYFTAEYQKTHSVVGIDLSLNALQRARLQNPAIPFALSDALRLPFQDGSFDGVVCNNIIEHVSDANLLLGECHRIIKLGGFLIISTPNRLRLYNRIRTLTGQKPLLAHNNHTKEFGITEMKKICQQAGFRVDLILSWPTYPAIKLGMKPKHIAFALVQSTSAFGARFIGTSALDNTIFYKGVKVLLGEKK